MKSIITLHATPNAWLTNSVLAPHLDAFITHLQQGRYAANTTKVYVAGIAHFAYWITQSKLPVEALDEHTVKQFLNDHPPRCDCPTPVMRYHRDLRAALGRHFACHCTGIGALSLLSLPNHLLRQRKWPLRGNRVTGSLGFSDTAACTQA